MNVVEQITALIDRLESEGLDNSKYGILLDCESESTLLRDGTIPNLKMTPLGIHRGVAMYMMRDAIGVSLVPLALIEDHFAYRQPCANGL